MMRASRRATAVAALALLGCAGEGHPWLGFVYPDRANLFDDRRLGAFETLNDCRASANLYLRDANATERGTYECGRKCRWRDDLRIFVCAETTT